MPRRPLRVFLLLALATAAVLAGLGRASARGQEVQRFHPVVAATQEGWLDAGVELADGDSVTVSAFGRASWDGGANAAGPEGVDIQWCAPISVVHRVGSLLVRAGGNPVVLAEGATVQGPGRILLAYNDCAGQYFDNSGTFNVTLTVTRAAPAAPPAPPVTAAQETPAEVGTVERAGTAEGDESGGGLPVLPILALLALAGGGAGVAFVGHRVIASRRPRFNPSACLESSAWLAPVRLAELQGEKLPKRLLTVGGPDADIDFGVPGIWARLVPQVDGSTRIERASDEKIFVDGMPLILGQRLGSGQRIKIGVREFVFREERMPSQPSRGGRDSALDKADPRVAA